MSSVHSCTLHEIRKMAGSDMILVRADQIGEGRSLRGVESRVCLRNREKIGKAKRHSGRMYIK